MNALVGNSGDQLLVWSLNVLIQVSFIATLALLIGLALRRSPAARYWLLCSALILVCLCPLFSAVIESTGMNLFSVSLLKNSDVAVKGESQQENSSTSLGQQSTSPATDFQQQNQGKIAEPNRDTTSPLQSQTVQTAATPQSESESAITAPVVINLSASTLRPFSWNLGPVVRLIGLGALLIWSGVSLLLLLHLAVNWYRLSQLLKSAIPTTDSNLAETVQEAWLSLGVKQNRAQPELVFSDQISGPIAAGIRTPRVVLPVALREQIDPEQLREILIHELAHIARGDQLVILLQNVIAALFWTHPLVRMLNRELAQAREEVCDNHVLATTAASAYSQTLLILAQRLNTLQAIPGTVGLFASRWKLEQRIAGLLDEQRSRVTHLNRSALLLITVLTAGTVLLTAFGTVSLVVAEKSADNQPGKASRAAATKSTDATQDSHFVYTGRVVDAQGNPIKDAELYVLYSGYRLRNQNSNESIPYHKRYAETRTNAEGSFRLEFDDEWTRFERASKITSSSTYFGGNPGTMIVASAPGYAPEWISTTVADPDVPLQLSLSAGGPAIEGRLINPEGQELSGVTVSLQTLCSAKQGAVIHWLKELPELRRQGLLPSDQKPINFNTTTGMYPLSSHLIADTPGIPTKVQTDEEGRFRIPDLGASRLAILELSGPEIPTERIAVVTRDMQPVQARSVGYRGPLDDTYYGARFTCVLDPGVVIQGSVRDLESGAPIAARLRVLRLQNHSISEIDFHDWKTDSQGHFRIGKIPPVEKLMLKVIPDADQPYFTRDFDLPQRKGMEPITFDAKLRRGVLFHGTLTDKQTGKPIPNAYFDYFPLLSNQHAKQYRRYQQGVSWLEPMGRRFKSAEDGAFSVVGIPGEGIIAAKINNPEYLKAFGLEQISDLVNDEWLKTYHRCFYKLYKTLKLVKANAGQKAPRIELQADPGIPLQFEVVGPDDKPITKFSVDERSVRETAGKPITLHGFARNRTRTVYFKQFEKGLGRAVTIRGIPADRSIQKVKLEPMGTVKGRLVSTDNVPLGAMPVSLHREVIPGTDALPNYGGLLTTAPKISDENGQFQFGGLIVGAEYHLHMNASQGRRFYTLPNLITFKPGQTIDLGAVTVPDKR